MSGDRWRTIRARETQGLICGELASTLSADCPDDTSPLPVRGTRSSGRPDSKSMAERNCGLMSILRSPCRTFRLHYQKNHHATDDHRRSILRHRQNRRQSGWRILLRAADRDALEIQTCRRLCRAGRTAELRDGNDVWLPIAVEKATRISPGELCTKYEAADQTTACFEKNKNFAPVAISVKPSS